MGMNAVRSMFLKAAPLLSFAFLMTACEGYDEEQEAAALREQEALDMNDEVDDGPASSRQEEREDTVLYEEERFSISSPAFGEGHPIPEKYTADGNDTSPPLEWEGTPVGTRSFALIVDDPDAPGNEPWVHWVIYDIPAEMTRLPEGIANAEMIEEPIRAAQGMSSFKTNNIGWRGPSPPREHGPHHYHFTLYALDEDLDLDPGLKKSDLLNKIADHVLAKAELTATYDRE